LFLFATSQTYAKIVRFDEENSYRNPKSNEIFPFPSINDVSSVFLSIIVPAYNEEKRCKTFLFKRIANLTTSTYLVFTVPAMLDECLEYLEQNLTKNAQHTYEVLIVDDGSTDKTTEVALKYTSKHGCDKVRVLTLVKNRGKGGAVRLVSCVFQSVFTIIVKY